VSIDWNEVATGLVGAGAFGLLVWAINRWRRRLTMILRQTIVRLRRTTNARALQKERARWVRDALRAKEQVATRRDGHKPTKVTWEGACPDEEWYFGGDRVTYQKYMRDRLAPPLRSYLGRPPRLGTRRPCPC
jgi:hypothetical protein